MDLKLISLSFIIFVLTLKYQKSVGEEVKNHGAPTRLERSYSYHTYNTYFYNYFTYYANYYYTYNDNCTNVPDVVTVSPVIYIATMSACYLISCLPCIVIGCILCVFMCVEAKNTRDMRQNVPINIPNTPTNIPAMINPDSQSYGYPQSQPVHTLGYSYASPVPYPGQPDPICYPNYLMETDPPSYDVCQGVPQPYMGFPK
ncbi:hypothetical protein LOD99_5769 [Oopsacas minuta]|uniref:Uncharacterized protein n=1 Tax=Oopsacas minuta TaxID=111878 RepID=A0AAV7JQX1_9METZ|nr:hypothetical protein LOD99_5769 [Oopsacas minuta]